LSRLPRIAVDLRAVVRAPTGIGIYTLALLRELAAAGEFELLGLAHRPLAAAAELAEMGIPVEVHPAPLGVVWQQLVLPRRLARGDVDLFWSPLLTLPLRVGVPAVVTLHDLAVLHVPETLPLRVRWSLLPFLERSVERADRIVVGTATVAREVEAAFPVARGKVAVVPHGVDPAFRPAPPEERVRIRASLGAPDGYFVAVGTVEPRKNLGQLLDAWKIVSQELPQSAPRLLLVGPEGWRQGALLRRLGPLATAGVRRLGAVERTRLVEILQGATALVYPSVYEGFGLPVAEAIACGVPAVVAEGTSPAEVAGEAGVACAADSPDELAGALLRLLAGGEELRDLEARAHARAGDFSWPASARGHAEAFRAALTGGSR